MVVNGVFELMLNSNKPIWLNFLDNLLMLDEFIQNDLVLTLMLNDGLLHGLNRFSELTLESNDLIHGILLDLTFELIALHSNWHKCSICSI